MVFCQPKIANEEEREWMGVGWEWMGIDGSGWEWMGIDGSGWE